MYSIFNSTIRQNIKLICIRQPVSLIAYNKSTSHFPATQTIFANSLASKSNQILLLDKNYWIYFDQRRFKNAYWGFSDGKPKPTSLFHKFYVFAICVLITAAAFTDLIPSMSGNSIDAAAPTSNSSSVDEGKKSNDEAESAEEKPKKQRIGFRDRKIIEYENRIREYSTPDKIFRYFATLKIFHEHKTEEIFMTPSDFVRSITPGLKQPEGLGLDQFKKFDPKKDKLNEVLDENSIFSQISENGLISFSDYMFLLVVLATPPRAFEIAFKMFDLNGDGDLDHEEFQKVTGVLRSHSSFGLRHREVGNTMKQMSSGLSKYFFGENLDQRLTVEKFSEFQKKLMTEIFWYEFARYPQVNGHISERDFADSLIAYAGHSNARKQKMMRRIKKAFKNSKVGISFEDYSDFFQLLKYINDIDTALSFYNIAGASIDKQTLKHVANTVAKTKLSEHLLNVVFVLFDENEDGELSNREFVSVMKQRVMRGLEKPKDTGFMKIVSAIMRCAKLNIKEYYNLNSD